MKESSGLGLPELSYRLMIRRASSNDSHELSRVDVGDQTDLSNSMRAVKLLAQ